MKYVPGPEFGQFSGSQGNTTASRNRFGSYVRNRTNPINPNSVLQQFRRGVFTDLTQEWRLLTESQRTAWSEWAVNFPRTNSLGQTYILTGAQTFIGNNLVRSLVAFTQANDPPAIDAAPTTGLITATAMVAAGGTMEIAYTATGGLAGNRFLVSATATRSPGKTYVGRSEMRVIGSFAGNAASPFDFQAAYEAIFGAGWLLQAGMEIVVRLEGISANGLRGSTQEDVVLIA